MSECREWRGARNEHEYGVRWFNGRHMLIHRWVWEQLNGPIPKGMVIMHTCDNPPCFLYDHLRIGTQAENLADMRAKGRWKPNPHGRRKLTAEQVAEIRAALAAGETQERIAERYGVWQTNISWIKRGVTWSGSTEEPPPSI